MKKLLLLLLAHGLLVGSKRPADELLPNQKAAKIIPSSKSICPFTPKRVQFLKLDQEINAMGAQLLSNGAHELDFSLADAQVADAMLIKMTEAFELFSGSAIHTWSILLNQLYGVGTFDLALSGNLLTQVLLTIADRAKHDSAFIIARNTQYSFWTKEENNAMYNVCGTIATDLVYNENLSPVARLNLAKIVARLANNPDWYDACANSLMPYLAATDARVKGNFDIAMYCSFADVDNGNTRLRIALTTLGDLCADSYGQYLKIKN